MNLGEQTSPVARRAVSIDSAEDDAKFLSVGQKVLDINHIFLVMIEEAVGGEDVGHILEACGVVQVIIVRNADVVERGEGA